VSQGVSCQYGERCTQAHNEAELAEWKEYFEHWRATLQTQLDNDAECQFAEHLMEKWMNAEDPEAVVSCFIFSDYILTWLTICVLHWGNIHWYN